MELTDEQKNSLVQWNKLGEKLTDNTLAKFLPSWFTNMRSLIQANFPLHNVGELATKLASLHKDIVVLGSGPGIETICSRLSSTPCVVLCGPTAIGALSHADVWPSAIVVADSSKDQYLHVVESAPMDFDAFNIVLPVHADPAWYGPKSPFSRSRLYFYLPYIDYMGNIDLGFNHIMKALFPDVPIYIGQGGSVAVTALNFADMICGTDSNRRIYLGAEFSWAKDKPRRATLRFDPSRYSEPIRAWHEANMVKPPENVIDVEGLDGMLQTDLLSVTYAVQFFWDIHSKIQSRPLLKNRFVLLHDAARLFRSVTKASLPCVKAPGDPLPSDADEYWAYKIVLGLVALFDIKETPDVQNEKPSVEA